MYKAGVMPQAHLIVLYINTDFFQEKKKDVDPVNGMTKWELHPNNGTSKASK